MRPSWRTDLRSDEAATEDRITRAARALCVTDGNDPETLIELGGETVDVGDLA